MRVYWTMGDYVDSVFLDRRTCKGTFQEGFKSLEIASKMWVEKYTMEVRHHLRDPMPTEPDSLLELASFTHCASSPPHQRTWKFPSGFPPCRICIYCCFACWN